MGGRGRGWGGGGGEKVKGGKCKFVLGLRSPSSFMCSTMCVYRGKGRAFQGGHAGSQGGVMQGSKGGLCRVPREGHVGFRK